MQDYRPTTADLARTVSDFLETLAPRLESGDRYQALVCRHLLAMVERELAGGPLPDRDEASLAGAIRRGDHDADWDATVADILARTIARVRRVKPDHLLPEHAA